MKKICLVVIGLYAGLLAAFSQQPDSSVYKKRKLTLDEINIVSSYYSQDGNNSAVTGGIGTEELKDYSIYTEVKMYKYDDRNRKRNWNFNLGVDYYTSASSDKINPATISSASSEDLRIYPAAEYSIENEAKKRKLNFDASFSIESDYISVGLGAGFSKVSKDNNREFTLKAKCYADQVKIILPYELRTPETGGLDGYSNEHDYPWKARTTGSLLLSVSQVVNKNMQLLFIIDAAYQNGFLSMPFHRIYFDGGTEATELLPSSRLKLPVGIRMNYFVGNKMILRSFYRFYYDTWGLSAHTADIEAVYKFGPFFSVSPFYRFYIQNGINYFAPYLQHTDTEKYYSSNYDLSPFKSHFWGAGLKITPLKKVAGISQFELRYGHYSRSNRLNADVISLLLKLK